MAVAVEAERALGAASAYLEAALDCVILADASGCIVEFNPAAERTFGYTREEAVGRRLADLIVPPSLRDRHEDAFARFVETGRERLFGRRLELTGMRSDGSEFPVELALSRVQGDPLLVCGALRDLSEAKRREYDLRTLAGEQAALRRVATLVARQPAPSEVFAAITKEAASLLNSPLVSMVRYELDGTATVIAAVDEHPFPLGSNWALDGPSIVALVLETGSPARVDDYEQVPGRIAERIRTAGIRSAVGIPITVEGAIWGAMVAVAPGTEPLPEGTELRLANFTELAAAAIANTQARANLRLLADEQAALRKVATLAAKGATPGDVFAAVAEQVAHLLDAPAISMVRFEPDGSSTAIAVWGSENPFGAGATFEPYPGVMSQVRHTGQPARLEDYAHSTGPTTARLEAAGIRSGVGVPIVVNGEVWGTTIALATGGASLPEGIEGRLTRFTDLVATAISNIQARDDLRDLADEQAALRRLAMQVASGAESAAVFDAVCEETGRLLGASSVNLARFTRDGAVETAAGWSLLDHHVPTGTRLGIEDNSIAALIQRTAAPGRSGLTTSEDRFRTLVEQLPFVTYVRGLGILESNAYVSPQVEEMLGYSVEEWESDSALLERVVHPEDRQQVIAEASRVRETGEPFRLEYRMVARDGRVVWVYDEMHLVRDADGRPRGVQGILLDVSEKKAAESPARSTHDALAESEQMFRSIVESANEWIWAEDSRGQLSYTNPAVYEMLGYTYEVGGGELAVSLRRRGLRSEVGAPVMVDGRVWGALIAGTDEREPLPPGTEHRLANFTDLVATAISRIQARDDLRELAEEQAALRRVATLVAESAEPAAFFNAVAAEVAKILGCSAASILSYEPDGTAIKVGAYGVENPYPVGARLRPDHGVSVDVWQTGRTARIDDYGEIADPVAQRLTEAGIRSSVGVPIVVNGRTWGLMVALSGSDALLPADTGDRLARFTDLVATAISNVQARDEVRELADEQAALRRVATLVARGTDAATVFNAVCAETGELIGAASVNLAHFTPDGFNLTMAGWSLHDTHVQAGTRLPLRDDTINGVIQRTVAPSRFDSYEESSSDLAAVIRQRGIRSEVGAPVIVEGRVWGALIAGVDSEEPLSAGAELRLARFAELVATAISNATTRSELVASRARIVTASDEARRRIERNLHDGTQQRLVALGLDLQAIRATVPEELRDTRSGLSRVEEEIQAVLEDVRELSRGLHPALLSQGGLRPSLRALARQCPIPVDIEIDVDRRPSESVETAVYYVVSEALTNAAKHSRASEISVVVTTADGVLRASIADDGVGGAEASAGSGLIGLVDRVEALGGRFVLDSQPNHGTRISIELPLTVHFVDVLPQPERASAEHSDSFGLPMDFSDVVDASSLRAAIQALAEAVYIVDTQGCIRFLNASALEILGYDDERQLLGRPSHDTIHYLREDGTPFPAAECPLLRPRVTGETVRVAEDWFVRQDGSLVPVTYSSAPVQLSDGRGAVVSFRELEHAELGGALGEHG